MITRAPIRPAELHSRRHRLATGRPPWPRPVSRYGRPSGLGRAGRPDVAILLTSELVTNAIRHEAGETVTLAITCSCGQLRVDVHDTSCFFPVLGTPQSMRRPGGA